MNIDKWREGIVDPYKIKLNNDLKIEKIISYPHAGNDVYKCVGTHNKKEKIFYLKIERNDKSNISNEIKVLKELKTNLSIPKVLDYGTIDSFYYIVTENIEGLRLSEMNNFDSRFLIEYGKTLAIIHSIDYKADKIKKRKINDIPESNNKILNKYIDWLIKNKPEEDYKTFIHGDFHYANILWKDEKISGILDWEYSGMGSKEQDIAWAIIKRQTQKFLNTTRELNLFLKGYNIVGNYDEKKLKWFMVNSYLHFYIMNKETDKEYSNFILKKINKLIK